MRHWAVLLTAVAAAGMSACSIPEKQQYPPYGCNGVQLPSTAQDLITISGEVVEPVQGKMPIGGALVELNVDGAPSAPTTTAADGSFVIGRRNGGAPLSMHLKVSKASPDPTIPNLDTYYYPSAALTEDLPDIELEIFASGEALGFARMVMPGLTTIPIVLAITVVNCNHEPVGMATVSTTPPADAIGYLVDSPNGPVPNAAAASTDPQFGTAFAILVPTSPTTVPASITVHAMAPSTTKPGDVTTFRDNVVPDPQLGALTQVDIQP